jgi:hypothetical protein
MTCTTKHIDAPLVPATELRRIIRDPEVRELMQRVYDIFEPIDLDGPMNLRLCNHLYQWVQLTSGWLRLFDHPEELEEHMLDDDGDAAD